jgi:nitrite reductase (NO-forming)
MNPKTQTMILAVLAIIAIVLGAFATTMELLPQNNAAATLAPEHSLDTPNISRNATDIPGPIYPGRTAPQNDNVTLITRELYAEIEPGASYLYWTFNGTVPGPMIRVLQNDNVTINIVNHGSMTHSIDLHAVIGPGGGMNYTQTSPGSSTRFTFKALHPGLYVYHCATAPVNHHIANGMYGMILVEPQGGLPPVDKEFYIMQGEFYTSGAKGQAGHHAFNPDKVTAETPDYVVFDGHVGSLTGSNAITAQVGQKIRIFFGVGGPSLISSFHIIGEIFDRVYPEASVQPSTILTNVQTTLVAPGSATIVEFTPLVLGSYTLVDHSITRAIEKGALGTLVVKGPSVPGIYGP